MTDDGDSGFDIEVHRLKNALYIDLTGRLSVEELEAGVTETLAAVDSLGDGFDVITDLNGFRPPSPEAAEPIEEAQVSLVERGMDRVVRVTGEDTSAVVEHAFQRRSRNGGFDGETVESVADAERLVA